jgi:hypothetical protein
MRLWLKNKLKKKGLKKIEVKLKKKNQVSTH